MTMLRLVWLVALIGLASSLGGLACTQEMPGGEGFPVAARPATVSPTVSPPTATAQVPSAAAVVAPSAGSEAVTRATGPTATTGAGSESRTRGGGEALVVLGSDSAASPSWVGQGSGGGFHLSPLPQNMAREGSLTVAATGKVTVAPDEAYVVVIPERDYGISGPQQLTAQDRLDILTNLSGMGIDEEAVEFDTVFRYEPAIISVEVGVDEYADAGEAVVAAIERVVRRSESFGVRFALSEENCELAVSLARREAVPAAAKAAQDLADALDVGLGEVVGALEYPLQDLPYGLPGGDAGSCKGQSSYSYAPLLPFDSEPEVEVLVDLQVSYRIP